MRKVLYGKELIEEELQRSCHFFIKEANLNKQSAGYGLIYDKSSDNIASIASVGYGLAAIVISVIHGWMSIEKAYQRVNKTLITFQEQVEGKNGFYYHFVHSKTGKRAWNSELSIIDTAIFLCGAITAGEFFGGEIKERTEELYRKVNWEWYTDKKTNYFFMGYTPEKGFSRLLGYVCRTINALLIRLCFTYFSN